MVTGSFNSQDDTRGTLIQTIRPDIQKFLPQERQNSSNSRSGSNNSRSARFNSPGLIRQKANTIQKRNYR